jgi:DNA-binding NtrC family response regulator
MSFKLVQYNGFETKNYDLGEFTVFGSAESCNAQVPGLNSRHFRLIQKQDSCEIVDLRSESGLYVNMTRTYRSQLSPGDVVRAGKCEFMLLKKDEAFSLDEFRSRNQQWGEVVLKFPSYAKSDLPILILGNSGTGKERISKLMHELSNRRDFASVIVNCSALTTSLAESELFGHVKGSFTGATQDRKGAFEEARDGTLILDEIGDLPLDIQPKLLRALENREIKPVGGDKVIKTNCRIIACTHHNLMEKVNRGEFRLDLFYRLNVIKIKVPALTERMEDFESILSAFSREYRVNFSPMAIKQLSTHTWPGNIRELKNLVSRCRILYPDKQIEPSDLVNVMESNALSTCRLTPRKESNQNFLKQMEKDIIIKLLINNKGNQLRTARELGVPKSTLYDKVKTYQIDVKKLKFNEAMI